MLTPQTKLARFVKRKNSKKSKKFSLRPLRDASLKNEFVSALDTAVEACPRSSDIPINTYISQVLNTAAENSLPTLTKSSQNHPPWKSNHEFQSLLSERKNLPLNERKKITRKIRLLAKKLKNEFYEAEAAEINNFAITRDLEKLYARAKEQQTTHKPIRSNACDPQKLSTFFQKHFSPTPPTETSTRLVTATTAAPTGDCHLLQGLWLDGLYNLPGR